MIIRPERPDHTLVQYGQNGSQFSGKNTKSFVRQLVAILWRRGACGGSRKTPRSPNQRFLFRLLHFELEPNVSLSLDEWLQADGHLDTLFAFPFNQTSHSDSRHPHDRFPFRKRQLEVFEYLNNKGMQLDYPVE